MEDSSYNRIDPDVEGNEVANILDNYLAVVDLNNPIGRHIECLEAMLFKKDSPEYREVKERFKLFARVYIESFYEKFQKFEPIYEKRQKIPSFLDYALVMEGGLAPDDS